MAYTHEDYKLLKSAIASGVSSVSYADKTVHYRSLEDMQRTLRIIETELYPNKVKPRRKLARIGRGFK